MEGFASAEEAPTSETIEMGGDTQREDPLDLPLQTYEEQDPDNCTRTRQGYVLVGGVQYWKPDVKPQADSSQSHQSIAKAKPKSPRAKAKAKPKTKGKAKPKAVSKAKAKTKAKAKANPKPVSKAKAKPKTKAKSEDAVLKIWKHCQGATEQKC